MGLADTVSSAGGEGGRWRASDTMTQPVQGVCRAVCVS